jgi:endothelin-converting enzyme/putative endopeptidase
MGVSPMFSVGSTQDMKDATEVTAYVDQGGSRIAGARLLLQGRRESVELRKQYVAHVQRMFELLGEKPEAAAAKAKTVMAVETALAKGSLDVTSRRDPEKIYHRMPVKQLVEMAPSFAWERYLKAIGAPVAELNVAVPDFFKALEAQIKTVSVDDWKTYLTWHLVHAAAPVMPTAFVNENFEFYGKALTGAKELRPRWKRCVQYVDADLGEALGQKYVEMTFGQQGKEKMLAMVRALEKALERDIQQLDWMTPATKKRAVEKLHAISNKIGYPEVWRDYSPVEIKKGDAIGNSFRSNTFEFKRQIAKIGKPVDKKEWFMTPPTVNAYYDPQNNNINFPAGILQPPFFDQKIDDAVNFGGIGAVIGHELTHGFDDEGRAVRRERQPRQLVDRGRLQSIRRAHQVRPGPVCEYQGTPDLKLNGKLTLGENVADNGGLRIALMALMDTLANRTVQKIDGFTPEQRLFLGWGQVWCTNYTEQSLRLRRKPTRTRPASGASMVSFRTCRSSKRHSVARWDSPWYARTLAEFGRRNMKTAAFLLLASAAAMHAQYTGFSIDNMDKSVDPCSNFFQYSCGNWIKANPIPADRSSWGTFVALRERNANVLRDILQTVSAKKGASEIEQKIGDHYVACMDEKAIDAKGIAPLKAELDRIDAVKTKADLVEPLAAYHRRGTAALFNFYSRPGLNNSKLVIGWVDQGGLGLPDRDYYVRTDPKSVETRDKYVAHMTRMFELAGQSADKAAASAKAGDEHRDRACQGLAGSRYAPERK